MKRFVWPFIKTLSIKTVWFLGAALVKSQRLKYGEQLPLFVEFVESEEEDQTSYPVAL